MSDYSKRIEITCWRSGRVLFAHEVENNTMRLTAEAAVKARANLGGANLSDAVMPGANLSGAYLSGVNLVRADLGGANLTWADLSGANLTWANLGGADLYEANLTGANLTGASLAWANLTGANLDGAVLDSVDLYGAYLSGAYLYGEDGEKLTLVGSRPILQICPLGSEWGTLIAYLTDRGVYLSLGCFFGTRDQFGTELADTHGDNAHAEEYRAALALIDAHERLWMPSDEASDAARDTGRRLPI